MDHKNMTNEELLNKYQEIVLGAYDCPSIELPNYFSLVEEIKNEILTRMK